MSEIVYCCVIPTMKHWIWTIALSCLLSGCQSCSRSAQKAQEYRPPVNKTLSEKVLVDTPTPSIPSHEVVPVAEKSLAEIIASAEPCVFVVHTYDRKGKRIGQGTGFFIENSGVGVSNYHVFERGRSWRIRTTDGQEHPVKRIMHQSKKFDYVVFQVDTKKSMPFLPLGDMLPMKGEDIVVLGNPRGLESTASRGIVSSIRDYQGRDQAIIQVDAAISPGSSGSPVMNRQGEVVGIATMKVNGCESCNYAFNINLLNH